MKYLFLIVLCKTLMLSKAQNLVPFQSADFDNKYGYVDTKTKKLKIFYHFEKAYPFSNNFALVQYGGKLGAIDTLGNIVIPIMFNYIKLIDKENAEVILRENDTAMIKIFNNYIQYIKTGDKVFPFRYFDSRNSKLKKAIVFNSDYELETLNKITKERIQKEVYNKLNYNTEKNNKLWHTFQGGVIDNQKRSGFIEFKTNMYFQNKNLLTGIGTGFQQTKAFTDTAKLWSRQIPVYFSQMLFLMKPQKGTALYTKYDLGVILAENNFSFNYKFNNRRYFGGKSPTKLLINTAVGIKISGKNRNGGALIELGYKFLPYKIPTVTTTNYFNLLFGYMF